jgi:ankyrin repeat protein
MSKTHADAEKMLAFKKACQYGNIPAAEKLIAKGVNPSLPLMDSGATPMHLAAEAGQPEMIRFLHERGASSTARMTDGTTPLFWAAQNGHTQTLETLVALRANPTEVANSGSTPLHAAACKGHTESAAYLLYLGASADAPNKGAETPRMLAKWKEHQEIVTLFENPAKAIAAAKVSSPIFTKPHIAKKHSISCHGASPTLTRRKI